MTKTQIRTATTIVVMIAIEVDERDTADPLPVSATSTSITGDREGATDGMMDGRADGFLEGDILDGA